MNLHDDMDPLSGQLSRLTAATPDASHSRRVRVRCHRALARRTRLDRRRGFGRRVAEPVLVGGFSVVYLLAVLHDVLGWHVSM
jgi:hypothetical protein